MKVRIHDFELQFISIPLNSQNTKIRYATNPVFLYRNRLVFFFFEADKQKPNLSNTKN